MRYMYEYFRLGEQIAIAEERVNVPARECGELSIENSMIACELRMKKVTNYELKVTNYPYNLQ